MFEKLFYWFHKKDIGNFSKEDQRLLYLHQRHWYFVENFCFLTITFVFLVLNEVFALISQNFVASLIASLIGVITGGYIFITRRYCMIPYIYSRVITKRGKAISKDDFKTIKESSPSLYDIITSDECCGSCYFISFAIMHVLKKGYMYFIAVKEFYEVEEERQEAYKIHVVFENNGWCFDTYSQRQMPIEELVDIWEGICIKRYSYKELEGKTFYVFRDSIEEELKKWCSENDCKYFVRR